MTFNFIVEIFIVFYSLEQPFNPQAMRTKSAGIAMEAETINRSNHSVLPSIGDFLGKHLIFAKEVPRWFESWL